MEEKKSLFTKIKEKFTKKKVIVLIAVLAVAALAVPRILPMVMMKTQGVSNNPFQNVGTRKALGATNGSIRLQFIIESIVICLLGGIIGIGVGIVIGGIGSKLLGYSAAISMQTVIIAVTFSMVIGVFFGYYPANKAAKLDPIEALRYE